MILFERTTSYGLLGSKEYLIPSEVKGKWNQLYVEDELPLGWMNLIQDPETRQNILRMNGTNVKLERMLEVYPILINGIELTAEYVNNYEGKIPVKPGSVILVPVIRSSDVWISTREYKIPTDGKIDI
jgi:hypothetical protein